MRRTILWALTCAALLAQDPYQVAGNHYRLAFENQWVRATRVIYGPHETAPVHTHPSNPGTVYVYVTDGGVMQFHHETGNIAGVAIDRKPVKAGGIRVAHGAPETHTVKYLGDDATEYARLELRTEPIDRPTRDVRLPPYTFDNGTAVGQQFENGQLRILRIRCAAGQQCPESEHAKEPAVVVVLSGPPSGPSRGEILWSPPAESLKGPMELVRIELKSSPVAGH
jgi:quercetin dioxygenase-like cupin family protein